MTSLTENAFRTKGGFIQGTNGWVPVCREENKIIIQDGAENANVRRKVTLEYHRNLKIRC